MDSHGGDTTHAAVTAPIVLVDNRPPLVGRFDYTTLHRNRPRTLSTWQLTTNPRIAAQVARLLGGHPRRQPSGVVQVITDTATLPILLGGPDALQVTWRACPGRACDGRVQEDGRPCTCPIALALRRAAARKGSGCQPAAELRFRLGDDPALGVFAFASEDWSFVELAIDVRTRLDDDAPVAARLGLRRSLHSLRSGRELAYTRPVLTLL